MDPIAEVCMSASPSSSRNRRILRFLTSNSVQVSRLQSGCPKSQVVKTDPLEASWAKVEAAAAARGIGQTRGKVGHGLATVVKGGGGVER